MDITDKTNHQIRVVIAGAGFAGLTLAKKLSPAHFQVVLIDRNNYHQFQPLLYQVATGGLEPSSISFPLRKIFQQKKNIFIRIAEVLEVQTEKNRIITSVGEMSYDYLVLAHGAETNFFGKQDLQQNSFSMKSVSEALLLRNTLLQNYEQALTTKSNQERAALLNIIVVGGGPTGVELAGAIAEMKNKILPKDYPELNLGQMKVTLLEAGPRLLNGMSEDLATKGEEYLTRLGVNVQTGNSVKNYDGQTITLVNGTELLTRCVIWAAGVKGAALKGLPAGCCSRNNRLLVDDFNRVSGLRNVFAIGDVATMISAVLPKGHAQVAPVAMQQATLLASNLKNALLKRSLKPFKYHDKGAMATIGRNLALAEIGQFKMKGFMAWITWMLVHLMSIIGVKNRLFILINWIFQYFTYDQSLRLIIHPSEKKTGKNVRERFPSESLVNNAA